MGNTENWKGKLRELLIGYRHNFTLREQLEDFISKLLKEKE